ncbi:MAG: hypothetical protein LBJ62_02170 [Bifidobacteriaceae bacterium]|jgi:hypothetical protein|nr:hypothetical protein [Bifidobacteriaceae bacterium]
MSPESRGGYTKTESAITTVEEVVPRAPDSFDADGYEDQEKALQELYDAGLASTWEEQEVTACLDWVGLSGYSNGFDGRKGNSPTCGVE